MKINSMVLTNLDKYILMSKAESDLFCVFIEPIEVNIFKAKDAINELSIECNETNFFMYDVIFETYKSEEEAKQRVLEFNGEWLKQFYVTSYKNGEFISENGPYYE